MGAAATAASAGAFLVDDDDEAVMMGPGGGPGKGAIDELPAAGWLVGMGPLGQSVDRSN